MASAIDVYLDAVLKQGAEEARADGSSAIEAHHLLLAIAASQEEVTRHVLAEFDRDAIRAALDREYEHSLAAAGVSPSTFGLPQASPADKAPTTMGASTKLALERGFFHAPRKKDLRPVHLLLGVLQAEVGTVPRALTLAGVDREDLLARARAAAGE